MTDSKGYQDKIYIDDDIKREEFTYDELIRGSSNLGNCQAKHLIE